MNKYKMISICSLTIACVLMLSILLPIRTVANEKESLEIYMHYENAEVTANIVVNSDVYTGIVCKYLITDDVLTSEDILAQTRDTGSTINLDKSEDDKYTAVVPNVDKRYVVFYVSIGNCSLCDYIDCNPGKSNQDSENNKQEPKSDEGHKMTVEGEGENGQVIETTTDNKNNETVEDNNKPAEDTVQEQPQEQPQETPVVEQQPADTVKEDTNKAIENQNEQLVVDNNNEPESNDFQTIEEVPSVSNENNNNNQNNNNQQNNNYVAPSNEIINQGNENNNSNNTSNTTKTVSTGDKDQIDTSDFEEIEKVASTSTSEDSMPQTGENDFGTILGIVVFSTISAVSFYKYKTTK